MHIRKNDTVVLLKDFSGPTPNKKGSTARVLKAYPKKGRLIVEGVNVKHKHVRANTNRDYPNGGIIKKEAFVNASNVELYCPKCQKGTRAAMKRAETGAAVRVCKNCGQEIATTK